MVLLGFGVIFASCAAEAMADRPAFVKASTGGRAVSHLCSALPKRRNPLPNGYSTPIVRIGVS